MFRLSRAAESLSKPPSCPARGRVFRALSPLSVSLSSTAPLSAQAPTRPFSCTFPCRTGLASPLLPRALLASLVSSCSFSSSTTDVAEVWRKADALCFDVDSTVCTDEGIDVLAAHLGVGEAVANLTKNAMEGSMSYRESLSARLELMKPTKSSVDRCNAEHPAQLSQGIAELVHALHAKGKKVFLVSGGFKQLIEPVALKLNIPVEHVFANVLLFDGDAYSGFDPNQPTSETGGKARAVHSIMSTHGLSSVVMIGDGATDLEAKPPAAAVIGYGGVVTRPTVKAGADWFVTDFQELIDAL